MTLAEFVLLFKADTKDLLKGLSGADKALGKTALFVKENRETLLSMGRSAAIAGGVMTGALALGVRSAARFQKQMSFVSTMVQDTGRFMGEFSETLKDLSVKYGESTDTLSRGLYDILSAGIDADKALDFLTVSIEAARGGFTTTAVAADALTTVVNAFGYAAEDVSKVSDIMFRTVEKGKLTYNDLAGSLGLVVTSAATAEIRFEELAAGIARLTTVGLSAQMAATALNGAILAMKTPAADAKKAALELGLAFDAAALKEKGFLGVMEDVIASAPTEEQLGRLFPDRRARRAIDAIRGDMERFRRDVTAIYDSAGAAGNAFAKATDTASFALAQMRQAGTRLMVEMGEPLLDIVKDLAGWVKNLSLRLSEMPKWLKELAVMGTAVTGVLLTLSGILLLMIGRLPEIAAGLLMVKKAFVALFAFLQAHPIAAIAIALGVIAKKLLDIAAAAMRARAESEEAASRLIGAYGKASDVLETTVRKIEALFLRMHKALETEGKEGERLWEEIGQDAIEMWRAISGETVRSSQEAIDAIKGYYKTILPRVEKLRAEQKKVGDELERTTELAEEARRAQTEADREALKEGAKLVAQLEGMATVTIPQLQEASATATDILAKFHLSEIDLTEEQIKTVRKLRDAHAESMEAQTVAQDKLLDDTKRKWQETADFVENIARSIVNAAIAGYEREKEALIQAKDEEIAKNFEAERDAIDALNLTYEERLKRINELDEAEAKARANIQLGDADLAKARQASMREVLRFALETMVVELSAWGMKEIGKKIMTWGPGAFLMIGAIAAAEAAAISGIRALMGSKERGGAIPVTGAYMLHKGEVVVPADRTADAISVSVNIGPVAMASDLDVERVADRVGIIVARNIRRRRRF